MLTGESLEQFHADVTQLTETLRDEIRKSATHTRQLQTAGAWHDAGFEMGRQAGLLLALARLQRALSEGA